MSASAVYSMTPLFRRKDGRTLRTLQNMQLFYDDAGQVLLCIALRRSLSQPA
jgi:hypothetical protein